MAIGGPVESRLEHFGRHLEASGYIDRWWIAQDICQDVTRFRIQYRGSDQYQEFWVSVFELFQRDGGLDWFEHIEHEIRRHAEAFTQPVRMDVFYGWSVVRPEMHFTYGCSSDSKAEKTAEKLFQESAKDAYKQILKRGWADIIGSNGTPYKLHKRAAYCVERPSDGARLCAIVPGVPLWDHLLGIKLMIEHDESVFLKTANVARA